MPNYLFTILLIIATVGLNTFAQTFLKLGSGLASLNSYLIAGVLAYGLSTVSYVYVLKHLNLSVAYPVIIGLTIFTTTIAGGYLLGEKISLIQWTGVGLMLSGLFAICFWKA
uniref:Small multidrug resistance protein n=1 Tax=Cyanothece sp. (strain PCC 7425 / ATCC 29141) TaxID=395961 RepID=B8HVA5_CYAP4